MAETADNGTLALRERFEVDSALERAVLRELDEIVHHPDEVERSFEGDIVDLQSERIEAMKRRREDLLRELAPLDAEAIADAMHDPALYLQYALLGFMDKCKERTVWGNVHYGLDRPQQSAYYGTLKDLRIDQQVPVYYEPELMMRVGFAYNGDGSTDPRFFSVKTDFRRLQNEQPPRYEFYVAPNRANGDPQLTITLTYWERGEWQHVKIDDPIEQHILLQQLVTDMEYELHAMQPTNDEMAKKSISYWVYNQTAMA